MGTHGIFWLRSRRFLLGQGTCRHGREGGSPREGWMLGPSGGRVPGGVSLKWDNQSR